MKKVAKAQNLNWPDGSDMTNILSGIISAILVNMTINAYIWPMKTIRRFRKKRGFDLATTYELEMVKNAEKLKIQNGLGLAPIKREHVLANDTTHEGLGATGPF